jgi:hypothetical protein
LAGSEATSPKRSSSVLRESLRVVVMYLLVAEERSRTGELTNIARSETRKEMVGRELNPRPTMDLSFLLTICLLG